MAAMDQNTSAQANPGFNRMDKMGLQACLATRGTSRFWRNRADTG